MSHYLDIDLLSDPELPPHVLIETLFSKMHHALIVLNTNAIGVTFPGYKKLPAQLGKQLRLVGPRDELQRLLDLPWLGALRDYVHVSAILSVPVNVEQRSLRRVQAKSSPARLRRRHMKRHSQSEADAVAHIPDTAIEQFHLPFIQVKSASTGKTFRLFLELSGPKPSSGQGAFNSYGLSSTQTVPWF